MSIPTEVVALAFADIVADTPIDVDFPLFAADEAVVLYGHDVLTAILDTDYTVTLNPDDDFVDFQITPTAAFLTKINDLIAADPTEENKVAITRILPLTTDITPTLAQFRVNIATSIDRLVMMLQQQGRAASLAITAPASEIGGPALVLPGAAQRANLSLNFDATGKVTVGPNAFDAIADAEAAQAAAEAAQTAAEAAEANAAGQAAAAGASATAADASRFAAETAQTAAETAETNAETAQAAAEAAAAAAQGVGNGVLTTEGDIVVADGVGDAARLAVGADDDVLTVVAGVPTWQAPAPAEAPSQSINVYSSGAQTPPANTWTKIQFNTEVSDPDGVYDNVTNFRFQPTLAGTYLVIGSVLANSNIDSVVGVGIYKNGAAVRYQTFVLPAASSAIPKIADIIALNGTTDYIEIYGFSSNTTAPQFGGNPTQTYFLARRLGA